MKKEIKEIRLPGSSEKKLIANFSRSPHWRNRWLHLWVCSERLTLELMITEWN